MIQYLLPAILLVVTFALLFLRTNAAVVFLMLCGGYAMVHAAGPDITLVSDSFKLVSGNIVLGVTAVLPAVLVALFLRHSVKKSKMLLMVVPALAAAALGTLLVVEQLPTEIRDTTLNVPYWTDLMQNLSPVVMIGSLASMLVVIMSLHKRKKDDDLKKKGKHHH